MRCLAAVEGVKSIVASAAVKPVPNLLLFGGERVIARFADDKLAGVDDGNEVFKNGCLGKSVAVGGRAAPGVVEPAHQPAVALMDGSDPLGIGI